MKCTEHEIKLHYTAPSMKQIYYFAKIFTMTVIIVNINMRKSECLLFSILTGFFPQHYYSLNQVKEVTKVIKKIYSVSDQYQYQHFIQRHKELEVEKYDKIENCPHATEKVSLQSPPIALHMKHYLRCTCISNHYSFIAKHSFFILA